MATASIPVLVIRLDYTLTNVTTASYTELTSSLFQTIIAVDIYDSSGRVMKLAEGLAGAEVDIPFYCTPGGTNGIVPLYVTAGMRLSIKAVDGNAIGGQIIINGYD